jgi:hypothetical protein
MKQNTVNTCGKCRAIFKIYVQTMKIFRCDRNYLDEDDVAFSITYVCFCNFLQSVILILCLIWISYVSNLRCLCNAFCIMIFGSVSFKLQWTRNVFRLNKGDSFLLLSAYRTEVCNFCDDLCFEMFTISVNWVNQQWIVKGVVLYVVSLCSLVKAEYWVLTWGGGECSDHS